MRPSWLFGFLVLVVIAPVAEAATIHGTVYSWETFDPQPDALVEIDTDPAQALVADNGSYRFTVPPGSYLLEASHFEDNRLSSYAAQNITVTGDGVFVRDLILLPYVGDVFLVDPGELPDLDSLEPDISSSIPSTTIEPTPRDSDEGGVTAFLLASIIVVLAAVAYLLRRRNASSTPEEKPPARDMTRYVHLPDDLADAMQHIHDAGGRMTQKELRHTMHQFSEAKMSLLVADLEDRGLIRKVKKGRGNILIAEDHKER